MGKWTAMFDGELGVIGALGRDSLAAIPARGGVLALLDMKDRPIVLIAAADLRGRLRHRLAAPESDEPSRRADLRAVTRRVLWKRTFSHFETDLYYLTIARAIWPTTYAKLVAPKPAWFVHVDPGEAHPHFSRTRNLGARAGRYVGPFLDGRSAERFIDALQDAFDLCRDVACLRQAPHGRPCSYAQMGRCASPCDGSISMDEYRRAVAAAADYAAGRRDEFLRDMRQRMRAAAERLEFERAAGLKGRLERIEALDGPACRHARPLEEFRFVIVQRGGSVRRARAFVVAGAVVEPAGTLDYPLRDEQLQALLDRAGALAGGDRQVDHFGQLAVGLVSRYLFSGPDRGGAIMRWRQDMTASQLAEAIEASREVLRLRPPRRKRTDPGPADTLA